MNRVSTKKNVKSDPYIVIFFINFVIKNIQYMKRMQKTWLKQHRGIRAQNFLFVSLLMHASIRKTINSYTDIFCPPLIATNIVYPGQTSPHVGNRFPHMGNGFPHMGHRFPYVGYGFPYVEKHSGLRKTDFVRNQSALKHDIVNLIY